MAKNLSTNAIGVTDLEEYLKTESDFAFELSAIPILKKAGFTFEHGGTYSDPVTRINRQFDLRAEFQWRPTKPRTYEVWFEFSLRLAIECKNIKPNNPLLISTIPRTRDEAYTSAIGTLHNGKTAVDKLLNRGNDYEKGKPVGKASDQIGKTEKNELVTGDGEIYGKWSQAINSSADLVRLAEESRPNDRNHILITLILPILLVPDKTLWMCHFDNGVLTSSPELCDRSQCYIGKEWVLRNGKRFPISHLEIMTMTGFVEWSGQWKEIGDAIVFQKSMEEFAKWCNDAVGVTITSKPHKPAGF